MDKKFCGFDLGTMNLVAAIASEDNKDAIIKTLRNMFIKVDGSAISEDEITNSGLDYIVEEGNETSDKSFYIIGEDSFKFGQIFNQTPRRPMQLGVISTKDIDAVDIIYLMVRSLLGESKEGTCVYSIPSPSVDIQMPPVTYHEKVFSRLLEKLGYNSYPLNESMAIIFDNCKKENYTGIGISFGCGLTNVACAYSGIEAMKFSVGRGGDWIDDCVSDSLGIQVSRVTSLKERKLDLLDTSWVGGRNKQEKRVLEALYYYYKEVIGYVLRVIGEEFHKRSEDMNIDVSIPIIISGGTSLPNGFLDLFKEIFFSIKNFPYEISEIRRAEDPLSTVAKGCLLYNLWKSKKDKKK